MGIFALTGVLALGAAVLRFAVPRKAPATRAKAESLAQKVLREPELA
jgi:hypothetical protein